MLMIDKESGGRGYTKLRRLRRDGNCFYRSFLFQLFEHYALVLAGEKADPEDKYKANYQTLKKTVTDSKKDMCDNGGYDEIVIEDFYDVFLEELTKLEGIKKTYEEAQQLAGEGEKIPFATYLQGHLFSVLCNHETANYIIMYMRFMAATYLKKNAILYEDFLGMDVATFCLREVEQVDVECDHPQIIAITNYIEHGVEINAVAQNKMQIDVTKIPEDDFKGNDFRVKVLFVPGHYDALYE